MMGCRSRSLVPVPVQVVTARIKKKLPVLEYGNFITKRFGDDEQAENGAVSLFAWIQWRKVRRSESFATVLTSSPKIALING